MRKLVLYTLAGAVAAFYAGVAGAAALPYVGAVTSFVYNATVAGRTPGTTPPAHKATPSLRGTLTASQLADQKARAHAAPTGHRLARAVQRLAASSKLPRRRVNF